MSSKDIEGAILRAERRMNIDAWNEARRFWEKTSHDEITAGLYIYENILYLTRIHGSANQVRNVVYSAPASISSYLYKYIWAMQVEEYFCSSRMKRLEGRAHKGVGSVERVEFFGISGVGKSSMLNVLCEKHKEVVHKVPQLVGEISSSEQGAIEREYRHFINNFLQYGGSRFNEKYGEEIRRRLVAIRRAGNLLKNRVLLEDEGIAQKGINYAQAMPRPAEKFIEYYMDFPAPKKVILVRASLEQIKSRNDARYALTGRGNNGDSRFFMAWIVDIARKILEARGVEIVEIDNSGCLNDACIAAEQVILVNGK